MTMKLFFRDASVLAKEDVETEIWLLKGAFHTLLWP
jgi:hypothetical protein